MDVEDRKQVLYLKMHNVSASALARSLATISNSLPLRPCRSRNGDVALAN